MSGLDFYVQSLNVDVTSTKAALSGSVDASFTSLVNAAMDIDLSIVQSLFRFHTDGIDIVNDPSCDITYNVTYDYIDLSSNPAEAVFTSKWLSDVTVESGGDDTIIFPKYSSLLNQTVPFEYVRHLAHKLFGTHLGVDLFSNEQELRDDLHTAGKEAMNNHLTYLADISNNEQDCENLKYITSSQATTGEFSTNHHPSYAILQQIINEDPNRLADISGNMIGDSTLTYAGTSETYNEFKMPFVTGDRIYFQLTINAATTQEDITDTNSTNPIDPRTYRIKMTVV